MIPKIIHYCWFGGNPKPAEVKKYIDSWRRFCPDYEIREWNENNFDISFNKYAKDAYDNKKYAFFTDVARLYLIYNYGGIYFDVDVEVIKKYDDVISDAFFGLETPNTVNTGLGFGAKKGHPFIKKLLDDYKNANFINDDGSLNLIPCPIINSKVFIENGFKLNGKKEEINGIYVYPVDFFNPLESSTGKLNKTENTHSIHWFMKSWIPKKDLIRSYITKPFHRLFGKDCFRKFKK